MVEADSVPGERQVLLVARRQRAGRRIVELNAARRERGALMVERARTDGNHPRRHGVRIDRHLRRLVASREDDGDAGVVRSFGGLIDRFVGIEQSERRTPGIVRDANLPAGPVREHVIVGGEDAEDEDRVAGSVADQIGAGRDAENLTVGIVGRDNAGDVRPVAAGRVAVVVRSLVDRNDDGLRGHAGRRAVDNLDVVRDATHEVWMCGIDSGVYNSDTHAGAGDAECVHLVGSDCRVRSHRIPAKALVGIDVGRGAAADGLDHGRA